MCVETGRWSLIISPQGTAFFCCSSGVKTMETPIRSVQDVRFLCVAFWGSNLLSVCCLEKGCVFMSDKSLQTHLLAAIMEFSSNKCWASRCWYLSETGNATTNRHVQRMEYAKQNKSWHDEGCHMFCWQHFQKGQNTWKGDTRKWNLDVALDSFLH